MPQPTASEGMFASRPSSPFFTIAAVMMGCLNLGLGLIAGYFAGEPGASLQLPYMLGYAVGSAVAFPFLVLLIIRLFGGVKTSHGARKAFFFISMGLFPIMVGLLISNVVEHLDLLRSTSPQEVTWSGDENGADLTKPVPAGGPSSDPSSRSWMGSSLNATLELSGATVRSDSIRSHSNGDHL